MRNVMEALERHHPKKGKLTTGKEQSSLLS